MRPTRSRQSPGGTDRLGEDTISELAAQAVGRCQIHSDAQDLLEPVLHVKEVKVPDGLGELGDEVDVAVGTCLVTCEDPKMDSARTRSARSSSLWAAISLSASARCIGRS